jgi:hypothetical protein
LPLEKDAVCDGAGEADAQAEAERKLRQERGFEKAQPSQMIRMNCDEAKVEQGCRSQEPRPKDLPPEP